jgi:hypothetical protein
MTPFARVSQQKDRKGKSMMDFRLSRRTWLLGLGGVLATGPLLAASHSPDQLKAVAEKGRKFLSDLFDRSRDLLPEFRGSSVYWLYHDNYLAAKVLKETDAEVSRRITKAIQGFGVQESGKIEIVFGEAKRPLPFRHYQLKEVQRIGNKVVKTEVVTDTVMDGWEEYADLLFLAALAEKEPEKAKRHLQRGLQMWDGRGFSDRAAQASNVYGTYKLALALIAADRLGEHSMAGASILERLLAQQAKDGGWITDYDKDGKPVGLANVETTSLAILTVMLWTSTQSEYAPS